jgi:hypothetical protein
MDVLSQELVEEFDTLAEPLRVWLGKYNTHLLAIVTPTSTRLVETICNINDKTILVAQTKTKPE